jgi:hypothetical protein
MIVHARWDSVQRSPADATERGLKPATTYAAVRPSLNQPGLNRGIRWMLLAVFALAPTAVLAQQQTEKAKTEDTPKQTEEAQPQTDKDGKLISVPGGKALGMSILGNQEAPKALVIVPWKRSELGNVLGISTMLDDSRQPIDKEVFMRMLSYYEIRSGGAPAKTNPAQPTATQRRKQ